MPDYDILIWPDGGEWKFEIIEVSGGKDVGAVAAGSAPTENGALAAAGAEIETRRQP